MTLISTQLVLIFSFFVLLTANAVVVALPSYATATGTTPATTTIEQPKPGIIMIITFENGTTKAIRSDSTNLQAVNGGYFIADSSVKASQPIQSKSVSNTVVQQLVSVFVDVRIDEPSPPPPTSSDGCSEGWGYYLNDPNPICEPLDKIGQGPPPDMAFCAALGCPYNPPAENELSPSPPSEPPAEPNRDVTCAAVECPEPDPPAEVPTEPEPGSDDEEGSNEGDNGDSGSDEGNDSSGGDESESEE